MAHAEWITLLSLLTGMSALQLGGTLVNLVRGMILFF